MARDGEKMIDYLERVIELEKSVYILDELDKKLQIKIDYLGKERFIPNPVEEHASFKECLEVSVTGGMILGMAVCAIGALFADDGLIMKIINVFLSGAGGVFIGGVIGAVLSPVWYLIGYARAQARLNAASNEREIKIAHDQQRVRKEQEQVKQLKKVLGEVRQKKQETQALRNRFYEGGPIYQDYRSFAAVCSFYQYFRSGKCTTLKGHEGAYVLYDYERKMDMVLEKLTDIQRNLAQIQRNQYKLYTVIEDGNKKVDRLIAESVNQSRMLNTGLAQNAIIAHNTEMVKKEMAFSNWLKTYELSKKGY